MDLPGVPPELLQALACCSDGARIALVGGAVRDLLLHRVHDDPWRGVPDLDLVVEEEGGASGVAAAHRLARRLESRLGGGTVLACREHGAYGTVEIELAFALPGRSGQQEPALFLLDVATARRESYPVAGENPEVRFGTLDDDLARRDFTINAMALPIGADPEASAGPVASRLIDPHGGQADLAGRRLRFLHPGSVRDDPTRLLRAARYAARLGFVLVPEAREQARATLAEWPWAWRRGDRPGLAPTALGTRLRMELSLLLDKEDWRTALAALQEWGGLDLLDPALQTDRLWRLRLRRGERFGLPRIVALLAGADDPLALAERLQLPHRQHRLLAQFQALRRRLSGLVDPGSLSPADWSALLEEPDHSPDAVALALASGLGPRRPLLRWWLRWRHLGSSSSAADLIAGGLRPGPALGERLRQLRSERLERERR